MKGEGKVRSGWGSRSWDPQLRGSPPMGAQLWVGSSGLSQPAQQQEIFHPAGAGTVPGGEEPLGLEG